VELVKMPCDGMTTGGGTSVSVSEVSLPLCFESEHFSLFIVKKEEVSQLFFPIFTTLSYQLLGDNVTTE
jgi:hypothetical protein